MKQKDPIKLNYKQKAFLRVLIDAKGDPGGAYLEVYKPKTDLTHSQLVDRGQKVLKRIKEHRELGDILEHYGLSLERWVSGMTELLDSTKPVYYRGKRVDEIPDNASRYQAHKLVANVLGIEQTQSRIDILNMDNRKQSLVVQVTAPEAIPALERTEKLKNAKVMEEVGAPRSAIEDYLGQYVVDYNFEEENL